MNRSQGRRASGITGTAAPSSSRPALILPLLEGHLLPCLALAGRGRLQALAPIPSFALPSPLQKHIKYLCLNSRCGPAWRRAQPSTRRFLRPWESGSLSIPSASPGRRILPPPVQENRRSQLRFWAGGGLALQLPELTGTPF